MWFPPHVLYIFKIFNIFLLKGDKFEIAGEIETQNKPVRITGLWD
jgi:hypothetical protein